MIKKILNRYKNVPVQVKASFWFLICAFLQKGISIITTPIFTRLLSTTEYGQYNVFNSWLNILTVFITLNLSYGVYTRGLVKFENDRNVYISSVEGLTLTLVVIWTGIYLLFHNTWNKLLSLNTPQMLCMLAMIWATAVFHFWAMEQRVDFRYKKLIVLTLSVSLAKPIIGIFLVLISEDKVTARIFGLAFVEVIAFTGCFFVQMFRGKKFFDAKYWKHLILFNLPLIPHYLSTSVLNGADRIMIGKMIDDSSAGVYSLAYSISLIMTIFNTALMQTIEPWLFKKIKEKRINDIAKVAYPAFIIIALVNIILIALAPEAVYIFAPKEYFDAIYVIPPVTMSVFFMFSYTFFSVFEFYYAKTHLVAIATCIGALANVILNFIFIKMFGYKAAGYTTLFCYIIYAFFHFYFMKKICRDYLDNAQPYDIKIYLSITGTFLFLGFVFLFSYKCAVIRYTLFVLILLFIIIKHKKLWEIVYKMISIKRNNVD